MSGKNMVVDIAADNNGGRVLVEHDDNRIYYVRHYDGREDGGVWRESDDGLSLSDDLIAFGAGDDPHTDWDGDQLSDYAGDVESVPRQSGAGDKLDAEAVEYVVVDCNRHEALELGKRLKAEREAMGED